MCDTTDYHIILRLSHVLVVVQAGGEGEVVRKDAGSKENWGSPKPKKTKEEIREGPQGRGDQAWIKGQLGNSEKRQPNRKKLSNSQETKSREKARIWYLATREPLEMAAQRRGWVRKLYLVLKQGGGRLDVKAVSSVSPSLSISCV